MTVQAYTPLDQGRLVHSQGVRGIAARHGVAPSAVALAWTLRETGAAAVAKTSVPARVREFAAALTLRLSTEDLRELDAAFPAPEVDGPLETI